MKNRKVLTHSFISLLLLSLVCMTVDIIFSDAFGAGTYSITFTLDDGAVTSTSLDDMGANIGQVLKFDGTNWVPDNLDGLTYAGSWDADENSPDLLFNGGNPGEYYIVSVTGETDLVGGPGTDYWDVGDWAVWNEVLLRWEKISNSGDVSSFASRTGHIVPSSGDYTWAQIDKTTSSILEIEDVGDASPAVNQVLAWDGSSWVSTDLDLIGLGSKQDEIDASTDLIVGSIAMSDTFSATSGLVGSPSIYFGDASGSGLYSPNSNEIAFTTEGVESLRLNSDGNVGIGTTAPAAELDVSGTIRSEQICDENGNNCRDISLGLADGHSLDASDGNPTNVVYVDSDGNVGVGVTSPQSLLHVSGGDSVLKVEDTTTGITNIVREMAGVELISSGLNDSSNQYGTGIKFLSIDPHLTTENPKFLAGIIPRATQDYSSDDKGGMALNFYTTPNDPGATSLPEKRMTIDGSGNVGIGTISPNEKLTVEGVIALDEVSSAISATSGFGKLYVKSGDSNLYFMDDSGAETNLITGGGGSGYSLNAVDGSPTNVVYVDNDGNVGIGVLSASEKLHIDGDMYIAGQNIWFGHDGATNTNNEGILFEDGYYLGSGGVFIFRADGARVTAYAAPSAAISAQGAYFSGNVGIGVTAPGERLHVDGDIFVEGADVWFGHDGVLNTDNDGILYDDNAYLDSDGVFIFRADDPRATDFTAPSAAISAKNAYFTDNVGIGSIAPTQKLDVNGTLIATEFIGDGSGLSGIALGSGGFTDTGDITFGADSDSNSSGEIVFQTQGSTKMTLQNDGNLGIGTTTPHEKLHINGDLFVEGQKIWFVHDGAPGANNDGIVYDDVDNLGSDGVFIFTAEADRTPDYDEPSAAISAKVGYFSSNVGIDEDSPSYQLDVNGDIRSQTGMFRGGPDSDDYVQIINNNSIRFISGGSEVLTVLNNGRVGILDTTPDDALDVAGTINAENICDENGGNCLDLSSGLPDSHSLNASDGNPENALYVDNNGNVGINGGTGPFAYDLYVNGTVGRPGGGSWTDSSDERLKKNIKTISGKKALNKILSLRGVSFEWINPHEHKEGTDYSLIAQELERVFPDWVDEIDSSGDDKDLVDDKIKVIHFPHAWNAYLVEAFKEFYRKFVFFSEDQQVVNDELNEKLISLKEDNKIIKSDNKAIKDFLCRKFSDAPFCGMN